MTICIIKCLWPASHKEEEIDVAKLVYCAYAQNGVQYYSHATPWCCIQVLSWNSCNTFKDEVVKGNPLEIAREQVRMCEWIYIYDRNKPPLLVIFFCLSKKFSYYDERGRSSKIRQLLSSWSNFTLQSSDWSLVDFNTVLDTMLRVIPPRLCFSSSTWCSFRTALR